MIDTFRRLAASQALRLALVVWTFGYLLVDLVAFLEKRTPPLGMFTLDLGLLAIGVALTCGLYEVLQRTRALSGWLRWPLVVVLAIACAVLQSTLDNNWNRLMALTLIPSWKTWALHPPMRNFFIVAILYSWTFCLSVTLMWAVGVGNARRVAEARAAAFEAATHRAEAAALRLQLNPHFLFNTLNGIASLVVTGRAADAEEMLGRLAEFLRASLASDPTGEVSLADEFATVEAYLRIEAARFSDRMQLVVDLPPELHRARVPNFILQPLVENAVKHGVAPARRAVTVAVAARLDGDVLELSVSNEVLAAPRLVRARPADDYVGSSNHVGLANTRQRLAIVYGGEGGLFTEAHEGGYVARIRLPAAFIPQDEDAVAA